MKRISSLILCILLIAANPLSAQKLNGDKLNKLTKEFSTPHLEWIDKFESGPLNALFTISLHEARNVVELSQRAPVAPDAITLSLRNAKGIFGITADNDGYYGNLFEGTSETTKTRELINRLTKPYETVLIQGVDFNNLSNEAQLKLFIRVKKGMGLVLAGCRNVPSGLFKHPIPNNISSLLGNSTENSSIYDVWRGLVQQNYNEAPKSYRFGTGRVLVYKSNSIVQAPFTYRSPHWWALYENGQAKLIRSLLWTAKRLTEDAPKVKLSPEMVTVSGINGKVKLRLRNKFDRIIKSETVEPVNGQVKMTFPPLFPGDYYCDIIVSGPKGVRDVGFKTLTVPASIKAVLKTKSDKIDGFQPINATVELSRPLRNGSMQVELTDSPNRRIWYRAESKTGSGKNIPIHVANYYMPNMAAFLTVKLFENGKPAGRLDCPFYFPVYATKLLPNYFDSQWEYNPGGVDRLRAMAECEAMGYSALTNRIDGSRPDVQSYMLLNMPLSSHIITVTSLSRPNKAIGCRGGWLGGKVPRIKPEELSDSDKKLLSEKTIDPVSDRAGRIAEIVMENAFRNKNLSTYPLYYYGLGDEAHSDYKLGLSPADRTYFNAFLKQKYGSIKKLNALWFRDYRSFGDIPNLPPHDAIAKKLYPEYLAHIDYVDSALTKLAHSYADAIHRRQSSTLIGSNGAWSINNDGFNMEKLLANPNINTWAPYPRLPQLEQLRCIRPDIKPFNVWGWLMGTDALPDAPWFHLLISPVRESCWFISGANHGGIKTAADYRPFRERFNREMIALREGPAQLLNVTPLIDDGIAIWENYESSRASQLSDPRFSAPTNSSLPFISYAYYNGLQFNYLFSSSLNKLKHNKVLFLFGASALGTEEAAAFHEYVKQGGIIIADLNPGIMNDSYGMGKSEILANMFALGNPRKLAAPKNSKLNIDTVFRGQRLVLNTEAAITPGITPFTVKKIGRGYTLLLNFTLDKARMNCNDGSYKRFMGNLLAACGVKPEMKFSGLPKDSIARIRRGNGFTLVGFTNREHAKAGRDAGKVDVTLQRCGHVYEVMKGPVAANTTEFQFTFKPVFKLFTIFAEKQSPPPLRLSSETAKPGVPLQLDLTPFAPNRVLLLQLRDRNGKLIRNRNEAVRHEVIIPDGKRKQYPVCFAYTDQPGNYNLTLTDVATGLKNKKIVNLKH